MEVLEKLLESIVRNDLPILIAAVLEAAFMFHLWRTIKSVEKETSGNAKESPEAWKNKNKELRFWNSIVLTLVSLFPLMGMLGTVFGLLGLDLATGDMENIRDNFFIALTSTAWGIIFSMSFKFCYAFFVDALEDQIQLTQKLSESVEEKTPTDVGDANEQT